MGITHQAFVGAMRAPLNYLGQRSLPDRLTRWAYRCWCSSASTTSGGALRRLPAYRVVPGARVELLPGLGHTPMMEDPQTTGNLLLDFVAAVNRPT